MSDREVISTPKAPAAIGPYSQAIRARGVLYCSGQIPLDPESGALVGGDDVAAQTRQVMQNLGAVLEAGGSGWARVVRCSIFLADMDDFQTVNGIYAEAFEGMDPPARATVAVKTLPKHVRVEIDAIALTDV